MPLSIQYRYCTILIEKGNLFFKVFLNYFAIRREVVITFSSVVRRTTHTLRLCTETLFFVLYDLVHDVT
jgi:hypothetical protein